MQIDPLRLHDDLLYGLLVDNNISTRSYMCTPHALILAVTSRGHTPLSTSCTSKAETVLN